LHPIRRRTVALLGTLLLAACGGSDSGGDTASSGAPPSELPAARPTTTRDAARLADQASFGATEPLIAEIEVKGAARWIAEQMRLSSSRYALGGGDAVHRHRSPIDYCDQPEHAAPNCGRDWLTTQPLAWDFYRNATRGADQLRQRVALALQQIVVVSNFEVQGTYGFRAYHNMLLDHAFGNYRELLRKVSVSPLMGEFLNNVNNDKRAPNENYARELLQLFSIGTCELNPDASLVGGACRATYDNQTVRAYAHALTGWTYPPGGLSHYTWYPLGSNPRYYAGDMIALPALHDDAPRSLLSGVSVAAGASAEVALEAVLESLMRHPNVAPFVAKQLIQFLVTSNPGPAYVARVATAFASGRYRYGGDAFGSGTRGDLAATVAAILLDPEARGDPSLRAGKLREPVLMFTAVLRALGGTTDGDVLGWKWGATLRQTLFRSPSVFNFYPPDYPLAGTDLVGPAFAIHNASTALERLNFLTELLMWGGAPPHPTVPGATGTSVDLRRFEAEAADAGKLVDRLSLLAAGGPLPDATRALVVQAVEAIASGSPAWQHERARQAAFLVFASPQFQVQR